MKCFKSRVWTGFAIVRMVLFSCSGSSALELTDYRKPADQANWLEKIAKQYPDLVALEKLGKTSGGNDLLLMTLGKGDVDSKPAVLLAAGIDAGDLTGTEILLRFIEDVAVNYSENEPVAALLNNTTFYIFPCVNPDAVDKLYGKPAYRSAFNSRPMDLDRDGLVDEDGFDDLNKDGFITMMRVEDPGGEWMEDGRLEGLLKKADQTKGELGRYHLLKEGIDNDKDGSINEDQSGGVNFDQNFTYKYQYFGAGAGNYQISEPESKAIADFMFDHPNISLVFSFSSNDNLVKPWKSAKEKPKSAGRGRKPIYEVMKSDNDYYQYISEELKDLVYGQDLPEQEESRGAFSEWAYFHYGRWSFSTPAWCPPRVADSLLAVPDKDLKNGNRSESGSDSWDQRLWQWLHISDQKSAIVDWKEFPHPDFPDQSVEIGGIKPFHYKNPPADSLQLLTSKFKRLFLKIAEMRSRLELQDLKLEQLHDNTYRLSVVISNSGYLPSNPEIAVNNKWCPKVRVALSLDQKQELAAGQKILLVDQLQGSGTRREFSWVILGEKNSTVKLEAGSPLTGFITKSIQLR